MMQARPLERHLFSMETLVTNPNEYEEPFQGHFLTILYTFSQSVEVALVHLTITALIICSTWRPAFTLSDSVPLLTQLSIKICRQGSHSSYHLFHVTTLNQMIGLKR